MNTRYFVHGTIETVTSQQDNTLSYTCAKIKPPVITTLWSYTYKELANYDKTVFKFDAETKSYPDTDVVDSLDLEVNRNLFNTYWTAIRVLLASQYGNTGFGISHWVDWLIDDIEFFNACYEKAIEVNPEFKPGEKPQETQQLEATDNNGNLQSEESLNPLG